MTQENLQEAFVNAREAAGKGIYIASPRMNTKVGDDMDYYMPPNGDKGSGKVTHLSPDEIHFKNQDSKETHKFKIMSKSDYEKEHMTESTIHKIPEAIKRALIEAIKQDDAVAVKQGFQKALFSTLNTKLEAKKKKVVQPLFQRPAEVSDKEDKEPAVKATKK